MPSLLNSLQPLPVPTCSYHHLPSTTTNKCSHITTKTTGIFISHLPINPLQLTVIAGAMIQAASSTSMNITMLVIPAHLRHNITKGDFSTLVFSAQGSISWCNGWPLQTPIKPITSFAMWTEAWTLYLSVVTNSHNPTRSLQIFPYQYVIFSDAPIWDFTNYSVSWYYTYFTYQPIPITDPMFIFP